MVYDYVTIIADIFSHAVDFISLMDYYRFFVAGETGDAPKIIIIRLL